METKQCPKCGEVKSPDQFHRDKNRRDGRQPRCKRCRQIDTAEYYARPEVKAHRAKYSAGYRRQNRDAILAYQAEHYQANPHIYWEAGYRRRAREYGYEPRVESFTREALIEKWGDACVYCGGPFEELDHHIPVAHGGPHTLQNARPSCTPCNRRGPAARTTNKPEEVPA